MTASRKKAAPCAAETLPAAIEKAYALAGKIHFDNAFYRKDIGQRALKAGK